ncbi:MAG: hypothetical protein KAJ76_06195 [Candidatus Heimdallarchaeota archaeon]|nr:hypothetical protein [Candidatus Heimdallarchaeota archaeon]
MLTDIKKKLLISEDNLKAINDFFVKENNPTIDDLLAVVEKYDGVDEINKKAAEAGKLDNLLARLEKKKPEYVKDLTWLAEQRDKDAFISIADYRKKILGADAEKVKFDDSLAVTLEISACQYFPFLIAEAKRAIEKQDLMPGRFIRVRKMKEQEEDGDLLAMAAAMQIIDASYVETLDTKGTSPGPDGAPVNVHLGGPATITGYFGGVGMPNEFPLKWADEYLNYYTKYGITQVLNVNPGSVLVGYMMHKLGIDMEFKISVFMGNDNPYACLWTLLTAKLFSRDDGTTPLIGFNLSNSVNNETIELSAYAREEFGFEDVVRIEHHITETYKSIVRQPYDRLPELLELADHVKNISAKHEGAVPEIDASRDYPTDILDYFRTKEDIIEAGHMPLNLINYLDKHHALNRTAEELTKRGLTFLAAPKLHKT